MDREEINKIIKKFFLETQRLINSLIEEITKDTQQKK